MADIEAQIKEAFAAIDTDGNGSLSTGEIANILVAAKVPQEKVDVLAQKMMEGMDADKDNKITCDELIAAVKAHGDC